MNPIFKSKFDGHNYSTQLIIINFVFYIKKMQAAFRKTIRYRRKVATYICYQLRKKLDACQWMETRRNLAQFRVEIKAVSIISYWWRLYKSKQKYTGNWINPRNEQRVIKIQRAFRKYRVRKYRLYTEIQKKYQEKQDSWMTLKRRSQKSQSIENQYFQTSLHHYHELQDLQNYSNYLENDYFCQFDNHAKKLEFETRRTFKEQDWEYSNQNKSWHNIQLKLTLKNNSGSPLTIQRIIEYHNELIFPSLPEQELVIETTREAIYGLIASIKVDQKLFKEKLFQELKKKRLSSIGDSPKFVVVIPINASKRANLIIKNKFAIKDSRRKSAMTRVGSKSVLKTDEAIK